MNKMLIVSVLAGLALLGGCASSSYVPATHPATLQVSFADPNWDGRIVPAGQRCQWAGGHGSTPPLLVSGIPAEANALVVEFSASPPRQRSASGGFVGGIPSGMPVSAARLTSGFGMRMHPLLGYVRQHSGVDLAAPYGSPIYATGAGVVGTAGWSGGLGLTVAIAHGGGVQTRYGHMSRLAVAPGQQVSAGDVIGYVGSTGESTGPHVHYEVRVDGRAIDPLR